MKKYIFIHIALLLVFIIVLPVNAQTSLGPLNLTNSSFIYYDPTVINVAATPTQAVSLEVGGGNYELYANEQIVMSPGFTVTAPANTNGHFVADIATHLPTPLFFGITDLNAVEKYQKMEMGISLPSLETKINTFLDDNTGQYKVASTGYNDAFANGTILNPYDPVHISVNALFYKPGTTTNPTIRYGFFYKEYDRAPLPEGWIEAHNPDAYPYSGIDPYEWRVRFSPDEIGLWSCIVLIYVNNQLLPDHYSFQFNVIPSLNPGWVKVADNNQYLQFSNGEQFFPVGDNYAWTDNESSFSPSCLGLNCDNPLIHRTKPLSFQDNINYIDNLTNSANGGGGGNHTRLIFAPWAYEIEFEKLGNYQTRQIEMFELDKYLEYAASKEVYLTISPINGFMLKNTDGGYLAGYSDFWPWNPYNNNHSPQIITVGDLPVNEPITNTNSNPYLAEFDPNVQFKGIEGISNPVQFFTDNTAKQIYKNKLRYIESRWGYSPNFYCNDITNEIDQWIKNSDFWSDPNNNEIVKSWTYEMATYIKNTLKSKQLTTVNYATPVAPIFSSPFPANAITNIWSNSNIDLVSIHDYSGRLDNLRFKAGLVKNSINSFNKPCIINENDVSEFSFVDKCTKRSMHNNLWSSAFSGSYGSGLRWEWKTEVQLGEEYSALRNFFSYIDLLTPDGYTPVNSAGVFDSPFEFFTLVKPGGYSDKAYGWVHNRSYNQYTEGDCDFVVNGYNTMQEIINNSQNLQLVYTNSQNESNYDFLFPVDYQTYPKESLYFVLSGLIPGAEYKIEYYYTSGLLIGNFAPAYDFTFTAYPTGSNFPGTYFVVNGPPTGNGYPADWAFLVHLANEPRTLSITNEVETFQYNQLSQLLLDNTRNIQSQLYISPNPNNGNFTIEVNSPILSNSLLHLSDISGNIISESICQLKKGHNQIQFSNQELASGVYFLKIDVIDKIFKMIIVK